MKKIPGFKRMVHVLPPSVISTGRRGDRGQARRVGEIVKFVERLEDRHDDLERRIIVVLMRIERVDVERSDAQYLVGVRGDCGGCEE